MKRATFSSNPTFTTFKAYILYRYFESPCPQFLAAAPALSGCAASHRTDTTHSFGRELTISFSIIFYLFQQPTTNNQQPSTNTDTTGRLIAYIQITLKTNY